MWLHTQVKQVNQAFPDIYFSTSGGVSERFMRVTAQWPTSEQHTIDESILSAFADDGQTAQAHLIPGMRGAVSCLHLPLVSRESLLLVSETP